MKRRTFDKILTMVGVGLSVFLFIAAGLLNWGYTFADDQVKSQLEAQSIVIPSETKNAKESADVTAFFKANGEKLMTTGKQAQMYADHYLGFHLVGLPPYAAASGANRAAQAALAADPTNADLKAKAASAAATVETVFKGTMLRSTLLTAYAFWQLGQIAKIAALTTLIGGILLLILSIAGWVHLRRTPAEATI
ncbi:MAG: hypothetical protein HY050_02475 [Actinobacteria bacterium]|nr:hypothetical protein [Actinomycetota bacterium]